MGNLKNQKISYQIKTALAVKNQKAAFWTKAVKVRVILAAK